MTLYIPQFNFLTDKRLDKITAAEREVHDLIMSLNIKKSTGHDGIGPRMLREGGLAIILSLTKLINMSLSKCKVPGLDEGRSNIYF